MDFGSWKVGLTFIETKSASYLVLTNDSVIGPTLGINKIIKNMQKSDDFWGITSSGDGKNFHLQSYFLVFRNKCFTHGTFEKFFRNVKRVRTKSQLVKKY